MPEGRQAPLVLVHLRRNETFAALAAAFGIGVATAHRHVTEAVALAAELAVRGGLSRPSGVHQDAADGSSPGIRNRAW
ncbi:transposase family protein [Spirillospora sp. CA-108201]